MNTLESLLQQLAAKDNATPESTIRGAIDRDRTTSAQLIFSTRPEQGFCVMDAP